MPISRNKNERVIEYELTRPNGSIFTYMATPSTYWSASKTQRKGEIFNIGGGSYYRDYNSTGEWWFDYGSHVLTPQQDFLAWVHMWGAGGGGQHRDGDTGGGGGGGFTSGLIQFKARIPYTIIVGQAGNFDNASTHGGGGRGHSSGGSGGGLSGLFFNTSHLGKSAWGHTTPPVSQSQALLIAGGGGGKGHHSQSHHGTGGGGGGWDGRSGHNAGGGGQTGGGGAGYSAQGGSALHGGHSASNSSWLGGGGGGWYGGGGGGHTGSHHNGGGGGSGHFAYPSNIASQANNSLSQYVISGHTLRAPGDNDTENPMPANRNTPLAMGDAGPAGLGGRGSPVGQTDREGQKHGKVVITLAPELMYKSDFVYPPHTSPGDNNGWSQSY